MGGKQSIINMNKVVLFEELTKTDLFLDAIYKGGKSGNFSDEPISKIIGCENQGGFRRLGTPENIKLIVIFSTNIDRDWPDFLDYETGIYIYYGDNKKPGHELHETVKKGNLVLKNIFDSLHLNKRKNIPPIFIFSKGGNGWDVVFRGLAVPGHPGYSQTEDLVAVWKTTDSNRFQNYKAIFTILNEQKIDKRWLTDLINNKQINSNYCPQSFKNWVETGKYNPLIAPKTRKYRTKEDQLPKTKQDLNLLQYIINYFHKQGREGFIKFEKFSAELLMLMDKNFISYDLTRPSRDGGRDAVGVYKIGQESNSILVSYAIEAKCHHITSSVGIKETSRLISRLLHRQFGVMVTTAYVDKQAYYEIREEDNHPVIIISGVDILSILKNSGISDKNKLEKWLNEMFSVTE